MITTWPPKKRAAPCWPGHTTGLASIIARRLLMGDKNPKNIQKQKKNNDTKKTQKKTPSAPSVKK
jgi:hypothetical protein